MLFITTSVICAMQVVLVSQVNTYITCERTQTISNWQPCKRSTWKGATGNCGKFQIPEEMSEQIRLFDFQNVLH